MPNDRKSSRPILGFARTKLLDQAMLDRRYFLHLSLLRLKKNKKTKPQIGSNGNRSELVECLVTLGGFEPEHESTITSISHLFGERQAPTQI